MSPPSLPPLSPPAKSHLKAKLPELLKAVVDTDPGQGVHDSGLTEVSPEVLHTLLLYLLHRAQEELGLGQDTVEAFVATIRRGGWGGGGAGGWDTIISCVCLCRLPPGPCACGAVTAAVPRAERHHRGQAGVDQHLAAVLSGEGVVWCGEGGVGWGVGSVGCGVMKGGMGWSVCEGLR